MQKCLPQREAEIRPRDNFAAVVHAGPAPERAEMAFTIIRSDQPLTKTYGVGFDDSTIVKASGASLSRGTARRITLAGTADEVAAQLAAQLAGIAQNEALILAPPPWGKPEWPLVLKEEARSRADAVARTREYFLHQAGPAVVGLDFDAKGFPAHIMTRLPKVGSLSGALASVFPEIAKAAFVRRPSVSAGIHNRTTGEKTSEESGQHRYFFILNGSDAGSFAQRLGDRLMLAGWGWGEVSKSGRILFRTLIDVAASSDPARLFYEANAILDDDCLEHAPGVREPFVKTGDFLNTRALPPLTPEECAALEAVRADIKMALAPAALAQHERWCAERGVEMIQRGVDPKAAQEVLSVAAGDRHELRGDFLIKLDSGKTASVQEILSNPAVYHKATCADPIEWDYGGGRDKAVIYTDGRPHIFSQAHGGIDYPLLPDPEAFFDAAPDAAAGADGWPELVDIFGDGDPSALIDVPVGALPQVLDEYSRDVASRMGVAVAFAALGAVVTTSAAVGGRIRIQPKERDTGWTEPPFLWGLLTEAPGGKKSPVMSAVVAPLMKLDDRRATVDIPRRDAWDLANKARKKEAAPLGPRPRLRRSVVGSFTVEAMREILVDNPKGALVAADEITGLIGGLDQYKAGGGSDRSDLLQLMNGQPQTIDRVNRSWRVACWGAAVLGGVQPKKMSELARGLDPDGLLQRFIPIVGDNVRRDGQDREPDQKAIDNYVNLLTGLADLPEEFEVHVVTLSAGAQQVRARFEKRVSALLDMPRGSDAWCGHLNKWPGFFARLLLVFHMADHWHEFRGAAAGQQVSGETAERVWRFAGFLLAHAIRFYETVIGLGASGDAARRAAGAILVSKKDRLSRRDLYELNREWRKDGKTELFEAMRVLERHGWCKPVSTHRDGQPDEWAVCPLIHVRFTERATAEKLRRDQEGLRVRSATAARRSVLSGAV